MRFYSKGRILTLPTKIRQGWMGLTVTKTLLAYHDTDLITTVKTTIVYDNNNH
jgi:hypothetical protein